MVTKPRLQCSFDRPTCTACTRLSSAKCEYYPPPPSRSQLRREMKEQNQPAVVQANTGGSNKTSPVVLRSKL
jgi:hypothetical protein